MKRTNSGTIKSSKGSPTEGGTKPVPVAKPKSNKSANNTTKRTMKIVKR